MSPSDPIVHYRLGVTWAGRPDAADRERRERSLRRAVELQPRFAPARSALAELLEQGGRAAQAVEHARAALDIEPGELRHAVRLAAALRAAGQKGEADAIEADLLRSAPSDPALLALIAWSFRDDGRAAEAEAIVRRVRAERPGEHQPTMLLAAMLARDKRHDEAEALYREAIALRPEDPAALNDLGYMNADRNVRVAEALQLIDRALRKWPEAPHLLDSRGWALFRLGRLEEAERELRRALAKTGDPDVLDHLGDVLAARGRRTEAEAEWRKALGFDTLDDDHRKKIEAKLAGAREG